VGTIARITSPAVNQCSDAANHRWRVSPTNRLISLISILAVLITVERASLSTHVLLQPDGFLHLHEVLQMGLLTTASVVISFLLLRTVSDRFRLIATGQGLALGIAFLVGTYFYATGNGSHEIASFFLGHYCRGAAGRPVCSASYIDDYFFGNIVYFAGLGLSNLSLVLLELKNPVTGWSEPLNRGITVVNALILAISFVAYDGVDRVAVGLTATIIFAIVYLGIVLWNRPRLADVPFTTYTTAGFVVAAVISLPVRLLH
jgi:hypothetical protein